MQCACSWEGSTVVGMCGAHWEYARKHGESVERQVNAVRDAKNRNMITKEEAEELCDQRVGRVLRTVTGK